MKSEQKQHSVEKLCDIFQKSRQAYYQGLRQKDTRQEEDGEIIHLVRKHRRQLPRIGGRKLYYLMKEELKDKSIKCGRDRLFEVLGIHDLFITNRRRGKSITRRISSSKIFPNLVKKMEIDKPEQVWASDTTCLPCKEQMGYLFLITDVYSKQIVGYKLQQNKKSSGSVSALQMALRHRKYPERPLIHHSDGGSEYFNFEYLHWLSKARMKVSCTAPSSPQENGTAERINGILKGEFLSDKTRSYDEISKELPRMIRIYNEVRPHGSINYLTPKSAHNCIGPIPKRWKTYPRKRLDEKRTNMLVEIQQKMSAY